MNFNQGISNDASATTFTDTIVGDIDNHQCTQFDVQEAEELGM